MTPHAIPDLTHPAVAAAYRQGAEDAERRATAALWTGLFLGAFCAAMLGLAGYALLGLVGLL